MALKLASLRKRRRCEANMYAIIKTGGKQLKVEVGQAIYVEKLNVEAGEKLCLTKSF